MAEIKVSNAFVEDVVTDREGTVFALRTSEPHRRKNDRDEWETTARTFRTVKASRDSGVNLSAFAKGDRIGFTGDEKTERREKDGKTYYDLVVWASTVAPAGTSAAQVQLPATDEAWAASADAQATGGGGSYGDDTPF